MDSYGGDRQVFPIYIGINRTDIVDSLVSYCVPYIHRDKPGGFIKNWNAGTCSLYT